MKNLYKILALSSLVLASSCKKYLDINDNPNAATSATPELVLSNALTATGATVVNYNTYASTVNGYAVNAGGYGGFGSTFTYTYSNNENTGLWSNVYDNLTDYQYIINQAATTAGYEQFDAVAKIMQAYDFHRLVDYYGDIPYTQALKGQAVLTPKYDKAETVYQGIITTLDAAITELKAHPSATTAFKNSDVVFRGNVTSWEKFANTLKLRLLNRIQAVSSLSSFATTEYASMNASAVGFIDDDVLVNPGYTASSGKQNPAWETYVANASGQSSVTGREYIPSNYVYSFYNGLKITDDDRGDLTYRSFPSTPVGQLSASDNPNAPSSPNPAWSTGDGLNNSTGILKGITAGQPLMLAAEGYFLQAEAAVNGKLGSAGQAQSLFETGIQKSYNYLSKDVSGNTNGANAKFLEDYKAANKGIYLVDFSSAATSQQKLEAIITQKYIALNFIMGGEAWTEFRRTGFPSTEPSSADPAYTFVSPQSTATSADKLPVRLPYPDTEYQLNSQNVPQGISVSTSRIFWDLN